jgi:hypothetical protein
MMTDTEIDRVRSLSWPDAQKAMKPLPSRHLVKLFDHRFSKVADTASQLLADRDDESLIVNALLTGIIRTSVGKLRAINTLREFGMRCRIVALMSFAPHYLALYSSAMLNPFL